MQRKSLNISLYRAGNQFKLRFIEMQTIDEPPHVRDVEIFQLLTGVEETFALSLSNALDAFNHRFVRVNNLPQSALFQRFCHSYHRKILTDADNPALRYTFHNIDWLLFDTNKNDERGLMMQLGAFDEALESFETNATKDGYEIAIQYSDNVPNLDDETEFVYNAFAATPTAKSTTALSRHIVNWMAKNCKKESLHEQSFLTNTLLPLLASDDNSLRNIAHQGIYIKPASPPSPLPFLLFAHEIKAGNRQPQNGESLYRQPIRP